MHSSWKGTELTQRPKTYSILYDIMVNYETEGVARGDTFSRGLAGEWSSDGEKPHCVLIVFYSFFFSLFELFFFLFCFVFFSLMGPYNVTFFSILHHPTMAEE